MAFRALPPLCTRAEESSSHFPGAGAIFPLLTVTHPLWQAFVGHMWESLRAFWGQRGGSLTWTPTQASPCVLAAYQLKPGHLPSCLLGTQATCTLASPKRERSGRHAPFSVPLPSESLLPSPVRGGGDWRACRRSTTLGMGGSGSPAAHMPDLHEGFSESPSCGSLGGTPFLPCGRENHSSLHGTKGPHSHQLCSNAQLLPQADVGGGSGRGSGGSSHLAFSWGGH